MSNFLPAAEIVPGLWVGSVKDGNDADFVRRHDIRLVINATGNEPSTLNGVQTYRVPVDDSPEDADKLAKYIPIAALLINDQMRYGKSVLVHCYAGRNRSATIVAAYLMLSRGLTATKAVAFVKSRKAGTFEPFNFMPALKSWETRLRRAGKLK